MKYSKPVVLLYCICLLKIICTFLFFTGHGRYLSFLSIVSIPSSFGLSIAANSKAQFLLGTVLLGVTIVLWLSGILLSLIGIKFKKLRKLSVIIFTIATIVDLLTGFIAANPVLVVTWSVASGLILIVCAFCLSRKETLGNNSVEVPQQPTV